MTTLVDSESKEQELVLSICKSFIHNQKLSEETIKDSISRIKVIDQNKLSAIFFQLLKTAEQSPYSLLAFSKTKEIRAYYHPRKKVQLNQLHQITKLFKEEDVNVHSYKGLAFTNQFYPNISYRDSVDIDFTVEQSKIPLMGKIMTKLNYKEAKGDNNFEDIKLSRGYYIDYSWLLYNQNNVPICNAEFHWQAANSALYVPLTFDKISTEVEEINVAGLQLFTFNKPHHALIVLCHHGIVDGWGKIRHLVDLTQIDKTLNPDEWHKLIELSKEYKVYRTFLLGCSICTKLFDYTFKNEIDFSSQNRLTNKLIPKIMAGELKLKWSEQPIKFLYYIQMRDSLLDKIKSIFTFGMYSIKEMKFKKAKEGSEATN